MSIEAQAQALIDLVEADRARQCDAILAEAAARAAALRHQARADARARMRHAIAEERERLAAAIAAAEARLRTHRRLERQQRAMRALDFALQRMPDALMNRWRDDDARASWVERVIGFARGTLRGGAWLITCAPGLTEGECGALAAALTVEVGATPSFAEDARLLAGLKVACAGNVIDGSLKGLLVDRDAICARLINLFESQS